MDIRLYDPSMRQQWNDFVLASKNGTFLFLRQYMEYHSDRFADHSFIFTDDRGQVCGLLPANVRGDTLYSHGGLTFGGLVLGNATSGDAPLEMFGLLRRALSDSGVNTVVYKPVPYIYHTQPAQEDLYALFRNDATLSVRNMATVIDLSQPVTSSRLGKRAVKRAAKGGIVVDECQTVDPFWHIVVADRRERHNTTPVHTAAELNYLKSVCPDNIRFFTATGATGQVLGGAVVYVDRGVIHLQYAACTPQGKDLYATDVIYHELVFNRLTGNRWFDFGTSNEDGGRYLNVGMVHHKEEFGGRPVVYDTYAWRLRDGDR